jgi:hypothetical protein
MLYIILLFVIILYAIEVKLGSSVDVYNSEIGYESCCGEPKKLSVKQFFFELIPLLISVLGLPFFLLYIL